MNFQDYIAIEADKCDGQPCVRGLNVTVDEVVKHLISEKTDEEILISFPDLTRKDLKACLAFLLEHDTQLMQKLKGVFHGQNSGASEAEIALLNQRFQVDWPKAYLSFLRETNGAEWLLYHSGYGDGVRLWPIEIIHADPYEVQVWLPGLIAIGDTGGDDGIMFDTAASANPELWPVVRLEFGALEREGIWVIADNFNDWITNRFDL